MQVLGLRDADGRSISRRLLAVSALLLLGVSGCGGDPDATGAESAIGSSMDALCTGVKLAASPAGTVPPGASVDLSASGAVCGAGETAEYRFSYKRDGIATETELQAYGLAPGATFETAGLPSGKYTVTVRVRAQGTTAIKTASVTLLVGDVCSAVTLAASPPAPASVGTELAVTANATCTGGSPEYRFLVKPFGASAYTLVRDWGDALATVATASFAPGAATLQVQTRAAGNTSAYEALKTLSYRLGETCGTLSATTLPVSPAAADDPVAVSATSSCTGSATGVYRFSYRPGSGAYVVFRDWGTSDAVWDTTGLAQGKYQLRIEVRASDYAGAALATKTLNFDIGGVCATTTLTVSPKSPSAIGPLLGLTAGATCTGGSPEYRFLYRAPGETGYTEFRGWGGATAPFETAGAAPGVSAFLVYARAIGNSSAYQAQRSVNYQLGDVCPTVMLTASPSGTAGSGTAVTLTGQATCVNGGVPDFAYFARAVGTSAWTLVRDFAPGGASWSTTGLLAGAYQVRVDARGQAHTGSAESTRTVNYTLTGCSGPSCGCADASECPAPSNPCEAATCTAGVCGAADLADGTACSVGPDTGECLSGACAPYPAVVSTSPSDGASGPASSPVSVTFSTAMANLTAQNSAGPCAGSIQVSLDDFASCVGFASASPAMSGGDTTATLTPVPGLLVNRHYAVRVTTAATSALGLPLQTAFTLASGFTTTSPNVCDGSVVISQIYGGGNSVGASYRTDFIELHNRGSVPVTLAGWSVQYASFIGSSWQATPLSGVIAPGGYFLVWEATGSGAGSLPPPNAMGVIPMSATAGKVALSTETTVLSGTCPSGPQIVDFVSYGPGATVCSGVAPAPYAPGAVQSTVRVASSCGDSADDASDFAVSFPLLRNSASPPNLCACVAQNESDVASEADYCNVQFPPSLDLVSGVASGNVYGRLYENGVTEVAGSNASVRAELGYGPPSSNPEYEAGFTWTHASFNTQVGNNDEYQASFSAPAPGDYRYVYRFSLDQGVSYTYCDQNTGDVGAGANLGLSFELADEPVLTVVP